MPAERHRERAQDRAEGGDHRVLGDHRDVLLAVALAEQPQDGLLRALQLGVAAHLDHQAEQARAVEHLHGGGDRDDHHVVHVDPELLAAGLEDADHPHAPVAHAHHLADGVGGGEELLRERASEHGDRARRGPRRGAAGSARARCPGGAPRAPRACVPKSATCRRRSPKATVSVPTTIGASLSTSRTPRATARASSSVRSCGTPPMPGMAPVVSVLPGSTIDHVGADGSRTGRARSAARPRRAPSA